MGFLKQIGTFMQISTGDDDEVWAVSADRRIARWNGSQWRAVGGALRQISVASADHVWGVNDADEVFQWYGDWRKLPGSLRRVSVGSDGTVVGVTAEGALFRWNGKAFVQLPCAPTLSVSVVDADNMYGILADRRLAHWNGVGWDASTLHAKDLSATLMGGKPRCFVLLDSGEVKEFVWGQYSDGFFWEIEHGAMPSPPLAWLSAGARRFVGIAAADAFVMAGCAPMFPPPGFASMLPPATAVFVTRQNRWRRCNRCSGLFFGGHATAGACAWRPFDVAATTTKTYSHDWGGSSDYALATSPGAPGQAGWRWCHKCEGLFFAGGTGGRCVAGDAHDGSRSGAYTLLHEDPAALGQDGWRYCCKCDGLFHAPSGAGRCPAGGGHDGSRSGKYKVRNLD
jgi:hypothetical protein